MRIGQGIDAHAFGDDRPLMLGGVRVAHGRGLAGHSDGDVLVHAVIDALLGAAGMGDIGMMFPSSESKWKGASSLDLLGMVVAELRDAGYRVENVDTVVVAEEPRLASYVADMRQCIARVLDLDVDRVNVKATTTDGLGFTGRGDGIAAFATVLLQ